MEEEVLVKYIIKNPFYDGIESLPEGNLLESKVTLTFPIEPTRGEKFLTGLTKEEALKLQKECHIPEEDALVNPKSKWLESYTATFSKTGVNRLDLSVPEDKLKYACLKARPTIYIERLEDLIKNPTAEFLITSPTKSAEDTLTKAKIKGNAYKELETLNSLDCRNILLVMGERVDTLADKEIIARVADLADTKPSIFLDLVKQAKRPDIAEFNDMLHHKILVKKGGFYITNDEVANNLGRSKEDVLSFIASKDNKDLVELLKMRLKTAKSNK